MRLTNGIRENVEARILNARYKDLEKQNQYDQQAHAKKVHEATYPAELVKVGEWVPMCSYIYVTTPKRKKSQKHINMDVSLYQKRGHSIYLEEDATFKELFDKEDGYAEARAKDGAIIRAVLNSCTTTKQLLETAPELAKYLPDENAPTGNALVDMATVRQFREMLG